MNSSEHRKVGGGRSGGSSSKSPSSHYGRGNPPLFEHRAGGGGGGGGGGSSGAAVSLSSENDDGMAGIDERLKGMIKRLGVSSSSEQKIARAMAEFGDALPEEYLLDPYNAEPTLDNLRRVANALTSERDFTSPKSQALSSNTTTPSKSASRRRLTASDPPDPSPVESKPATTPSDLLRAADEDIALHSARIRATADGDPDLLLLLLRENALKKKRGEQGSSHATASQAIQLLEQDPERNARADRIAKRMDRMEELRQEASNILRALDVASSTAGADTGKIGMTQADILDERLERWGRALELYIFAPTHADASASTDATSSPSSVDLLGLLDKLCEGCVEEEELAEALSQASQMCGALVDSTSMAVRDAAEDAAEAEDAYHIRLEAHSILSRFATERADAIEEQFRTNGRAALKIGQQLELAEAQRRQCESASVLVKRWWMMENLAEQEEMSGEEIKVHEEIRGVLPSASCRMDPLFTRAENSLEAARALKALRTVVRSRGSSASGALLDPRSIRRFELTGKLIQRTSAALEARLLNSFSEIYGKGGTYDFSSTAAAGRPGRLNWVKLRQTAEALMSFDSGRSLQKRYVNLVVTTRFPELFNNNDRRTNTSLDEDDHDADLGDEEFDMDATRSKLSSLFHRVCEVCTAEFQLIAHVFSSSSDSTKTHASSSGTDNLPLQVARALLQRVVGDPRNGLENRINDLLASVDRRGDFDAGAKKLDTFVVIHEKAAGLFSLLREAAQNMLVVAPDSKGDGTGHSNVGGASERAVASLVQFLASQEIALSNGHRRGYLNLELRLLHHECCAGLDRIGAKMLKPRKSRDDPPRSTPGAAGLADYRAPVMPLNKASLKEGGYAGLLNGPLKQSVLRHPLMQATDSLARARLMFGASQGGSGGDTESTARVITAIYSQMCTFYGQSYLFPIVETLEELLNGSHPPTPPSLPFDEDSPPHDLGVDGNFWVGVERIHSAAKSFDRELWAEQRTGSARVWEILVATRSRTSLNIAKDRRIRFFQELEERGEAAIRRALDTLSAHIKWILVVGGESMLATGGTRLLGNLTGNQQGPYAVPAGSSLEAPNSPAVKSLTYCLRAQFVHIQAALTPQSLSAFWTALSMRLYDVLCARLLQYYYVSTVGAVILSRDVEALRSVAMLAGSDHSHWDNLRELLTLYMTPPDSLKTMLVGPDGDVNSGKGLFARAGRDQSLVFMSRRVDYRIKTNQGVRTCQWAVDLMTELGVEDPTDRPLNISLYSAERKA